MASSSSLFFNGTNAPNISREEFNLFHTIDRKLFTRLVFNLGRDPAESAQVMALWLWLEKNAKEIYLVNKILHTLPESFLNIMADESVMVLNCLGSDDFPYKNISPAIIELPVLQRMTQTALTPWFFHENRVQIIRGVTDLFNQVCLLAFEDLSIQNDQETSRKRTRVHDSSKYHQTQSMNGVGCSSSTSSNIVDGGFDPSDVAVQREVLNFEIGDVLSHLKLNEEASVDGTNSQAVPADYRTIFLTFSKGYHIPGNEIKDFFNNQYADMVEDVIMQEVKKPDEQPLYGRLVVSSSAIVDLVLEGKSRMKFTIKGKHFWATTYLPKGKKPYWARKTFTSASFS